MDKKKFGPVAWTVIVLVGAALVLMIAAFALRFEGARWRVSELRGLTSTRAPVLPEDLRRAESSLPEPTAWLGQLVSARERWSAASLADPAAFAALRARSAQGDLGGDAEALFVQLEDCARADPTTPQPAVAVQRVLDILIANDGIVAIPPCGLEAVRLAALGTASYVEVAHRAGRYGPIDPAVIVASLAANDAAFATLPIDQSLALGAALRVEMLHAAWADRPESVVELLRAQGDVARIFAGGPFLVSAFGALDAQRSLLAMLEMALPRLASGTDLSWLEADLDAQRPRALLATAAAGERAFGNRAFELLRTGGELGALSSGSMLPRSLTISYDQAFFVRGWTRRIEALDEPAFRREATPEIGWFDRQAAPVSAALSSAPDAITDLADEIEARLVLARAALLAFRTDAQELLKFVSTTRDPFDGQPIRVGFNAEGLVILWSVGHDGVDDGGTDDQKDIVWRYKPR